MAGEGGWDATRPHLEGRLWTRAIPKRSPPGVQSETEDMGAEYEIQGAEDSTSSCPSPVATSTSRVSTSWFLGHQTSSEPNFRCRIGHAPCQSKGDPSITHCREANRSSSPVYWLTGCIRRSNRRAVVPDSALATAVTAFWSAGIEDLFIDGTFCTEKPDPGDADGYGSNLAMVYMIESILVGWIFKWFSFHMFGKGSGGCGQTMAWSSSSIPQCRPLRPSGSRSSSGQIATVDLGA
jgi:hypothetical protein